MLSLSALAVSSMLLATPDVTPPAENPAAAWRPAYIVAGVVLGTAGGGFIGYQIGAHQECTGCIVNLNPVSGAFIGGVAGGVVGGLLTGIITGYIFQQPANAPPPVTLIPTAGGRETAGLHLLMTF